MPFVSACPLRSRIRLGDELRYRTTVSNSASQALKMFRVNDATAPTDTDRMNGQLMAIVALTVSPLKSCEAKPVALPPGRARLATRRRRRDR